MIGMPTRSPLCGPEPINVGTGEVESFPGFYLRLAAANAVQPSRFRYLKLPVFSEGFESDLSLLRATEPAEILSQWTSGTNMGLRLAEAFARLTGRPNVSATALHFYTGSIETVRLHRTSPAFCPQCLADDPIPYERLQWCLRLVTICPHHNTQLRDRCPKCDAPWRRGLSGHDQFLCRVCGAHATGTEGVTRDPEPDPENAAKSRRFSKFFNSLFSRKIDLTGVDLAASIKWFCEKLGAHSIPQQERLIGIRRGCLSDWYSGKHRPSLVKFLDWCDSIRVEPAHIVQRNASWDATELRLNTPRTSVYWTRKKPRAQSFEEVAAEVFKLSEAHPTFGLAALARTMKLDVKTLRRALGESTASAIVEQARRARFGRDGSYTERSVAEVDRIFDTLVADGLKITHREIAKRLEKPGRLLNPQVRAHIKAKLGNLRMKIYTSGNPEPGV